MKSGFFEEFLSRNVHPILFSLFFIIINIEEAKSVISLIDDSSISSTCSGYAQDLCNLQTVHIVKILKRKKTIKKLISSLSQIRIQWFPKAAEHGSHRHMGIPESPSKWNPTQGRLRPFVHKMKNNGKFTRVRFFWL